ncbi:MAG TPA: P1 family peptidase [Desulfitobacteriaceae bacterium]|nr:P1 family peptidase [Desulfitobacteriaceae bacterium]
MKRQTPRELGIWMGDMDPGPNNDISDVPNVLVGHVSLLSGHGKLIPGKGPVRTGVTAILPRGTANIYRQPCYAGIEVFNGYGKSIGVPFIQETGLLNSPIMLTNTLSVNNVANGLLTYLLNQNPEIGVNNRTPNLVVFECDDSYLNDIRGRHVHSSDAQMAIQCATIGPIGQGNIGAGVGMSCFQLKGGIGSSSRMVKRANGQIYSLGMLALANFGLLRDLLIEGVPVGKSLEIDMEEDFIPGSLILIGVTNAPLDRWQLSGLARRAVLGQARTGSISMVGSGDFCLIVSNAFLYDENVFSDWELDEFYRAVVETSAESIWNALFLAETLAGRDEHIRRAIPLKHTMEILKKWPRISR